MNKIQTIKHIYSLYREGKDVEGDKALLHLADTIRRSNENHSGDLSAIKIEAIVAIYGGLNATSELLDCSINTIRKWVYGRSKPQERFLQKLHQMYNNRQREIDEMVSYMKLYNQ